MATAIVLVIILAIAIAAFFTKEVASAILHGVALVGWIIGGYLLYNQTYSNQNTYVQTAVFLFATILVIAHLAMLIISLFAYFASQKQKRLGTYDRDRQQVLDRIRRATHG